MDWWRLFHIAAKEMHWPPEVIGRLTPTQLMALGNERDPRIPVYQGAAAIELMERIAEERRAWESKACSS